MINSCVILYLLLLAVHGSIQKSSPASLTYRAGVVELTSVFHENDSAKTLNDNVKKYVGFIEQAAEKEVDIVVFPELGLTSLTFVERTDLIPRSTLIPDPSQNYTPCTNSSIPVNEALKKIACAAERNSVYVTVNLLEKEVCPGNDCPNDGIFLYVTSVTFDRKGQIIARYRNSHPFSGYGKLDSMRTPEISTFDTDFGVTFGNIICFDIMYEEPWLTLTRKLNITDIIYSSGWFSQMPFLTTVQMEAGWAYSEDVNILASGHNKIESGMSGSGIFAGRQGIVTAILPLHDHEELLVADVRKKPKKNVATLMPNHNQGKVTNEAQEHHAYNELISQGRDSRIFKWSYEKLDDFKTKLITKDGMIVQKLNHNEVKCRFEVNVTNISPPTTYRLLAFDGARPFSNAIILGTRACAIVQCANETLDSCGHVQNSSAIFNFMTITAMYVDNTRTVMMPSTLGADTLPLQKWSLKEYKYKKEISRSISLTAPTQNVVTFGVWGRNFEADEILVSTQRGYDNLEEEKDDKISSATRIFNQTLYLPLVLLLLKNMLNFFENFKYFP